MNPLLIAVFFAGLVVGGMSLVLISALALGALLDDRRERVKRLEIIRHNVRVFLARRHGNETVLTVPGFLGNPVHLTRDHCRKIRAAS